jgi:hypothetical protein
MTDSIALPITSLPGCDVAVVGGGTTGVCAAIAAARAGARTVLVEGYGFLGGNAATGLPWLGFHAPDGTQVVRGLIHEVAERLRAVGGASAAWPDPICGSAVAVNPGWLKVVLAAMAQEAGVRLLLAHQLVGAVRDGQRVAALHLMSRSGLRRLPCAAAIDCTDAGDLLLHAGAQLDFGRTDGRTQAASLMVRIAGIDMPALCAWLQAHPDQWRPFAIAEGERERLLGGLIQAPVFVLGGLPEAIARARADGLDLARDRLIGVAQPQEGILALVATRVDGPDPCNPEAMQQATLAATAQIGDLLRFVRGYVPGGAGAWLLDVGHQLGIRETRHCRCEHVLTADDLLSGRVFPDAVACGAYHLDIHRPDAPSLAAHRAPRPYTIAWRCLVPLGLDNLLVAGRCIGADHEAMSSTRVIPISAALGEAAGIGAALAVGHGVAMRAVDTGALARRLDAVGAIRAA